MQTKQEINYQQINTLVFEGGSVKGLAYVGALQTLNAYLAQEQKDFCLFNQIKHVAGTSAGSIMALLIALGLNLDQISIVMQETSFSSFADMGFSASYGGNIGKGAALYQYGYLCEGNAFMQWVKREIQHHTDDENITFARLKETKGKDLHVYAVCLNDGKVVEFNAQNTPNVSVALAVRMSMSIPAFFKPVRVSESLDEQGKLMVTLDEDQGTTYYVDGGAKANYPYPLIKKSQQLDDEQMLGFKVDSHDEIFQTAAAQGAEQYLQPYVRERNKIEGGYGVHLFTHILNALMSPQDDIHRSNPLEYARTIYCWDSDVSTFDFNLTPEKIKALLAAGVVASRAFIGKHPHSAVMNEIENFPPLDKQLEQAVKIPEAESEFAESYKKAEGERIQPMVKKADRILTDKIENEEPITEEEWNYFQGLAKDSAKINDIVEIRGTVGKVIGRHANATQVRQDNFAQASQHLLQMIEMGVNIQRKVERGAQVNTISNEVGNLDGQAGFFKQYFSNTDFITEAEVVLERLNKSPSSRPQQRLVNELTKAIANFDNHREIVEDVKIKTSIEAIEQAKDSITGIIKTACEFLENLEQQNQPAHRGTASSPGFFSPASTHLASDPNQMENTLGK